MNRRHSLKAFVAALTVTAAASPLLPIERLAAATPHKSAEPVKVNENLRVRYKTEVIDGVDVFYREAGPKDGPTVLLLHGFPTSSHMFRNLIPALADKYHVIAPDYPGFGHSAQPEREKFAYTFDHFAQIIEKLTEKLGLKSYALYVMDYGAPVGFRLAAKHPDRVSALIVQNGNAYEDGLQQFWDPIKAYWKSGGAERDREAMRQNIKIEATKFQYTDGVKDLTLVSPDTWTADQAGLDRPGNAEIQLDLLYDYRTNLALYPVFQEYFRKNQPETLIVWGKNDVIFPEPGARAYQRDLPNAELHLLDTGHFALESHGLEIAALVRDFLGRKLK